MDEITLVAPQKIIDGLSKFVDILNDEEFTRLTLEVLKECTVAAKYRALEYELEEAVQHSKPISIIIGSVEIDINPELLEDSDDDRFLDRCFKTRKWHKA